jgi:hypothetical protein
MPVSRYSVKRRARAVGLGWVILGLRRVTTRDVASTLDQVA